LRSGAPVIDPVYELLEHTLERTGPLPVLLERDNDVPSLDELLDEVARLRATYRRAIGVWEAKRAGAARTSVH
jgi:uncharacterized protein (UPF0276 family)